MYLLCMPERCYLALPLAGQNLRLAIRVGDTLSCWAFRRGWAVMWAICLSLLRGSTCGVVDLRRVGIVCLPATCRVCSAVPWLLPSVPGLFLAFLGAKNNVPG